ncbi:MAG: trypsin-like peptidase domain-containing protein [Elusimicrobia bacterium]|nr:trypsin-like peptidase domain-containing protein [Elusimicrobiota bacterium]
MKGALKAILGLTILTSALPLMSFAEDGSSKSIYGEDNRVDFFSASADMQKLSDSVVSFWDAKKAVLDAASKTYTLTTENYGDKLNLCPEEKFRDQTIGAFCSGSLVGADLVITAGHCITDQTKCNNTKLVFGYAVKEEGGQAPAKIAEGEVYSCKKIVKRFQGAEPAAGSSASAGGLGPDYALIQLDRKVKGHTPLTVNRKQNLKKGDGIFVIGHPVGLPLKISDGATVRDAAPAGYFVTDLDTFGGNSGSPVFNAKTKAVEGILVRGDEDFVQSPAGCTTMAKYDQNGGRGEDVTKISELQASIPKLASEKKAAAVVQANTIKAVEIGDIGALRGLDAEDISFK